MCLHTHKLLYGVQGFQNIVLIYMSFIGILSKGKGGDGTGDKQNGDDVYDPFKATSLKPWGDDSKCIKWSCLHSPSDVAVIVLNGVPFMNSDMPLDFTTSGCIHQNRKIVSLVKKPVIQMTDSSRMIFWPILKSRTYLHMLSATYDRPYL